MTHYVDCRVNIFKVSKVPKSLIKIYEPATKSTVLLFLHRARVNSPGQYTPDGGDGHSTPDRDVADGHSLNMLVVMDT